MITLEEKDALENISHNDMAIRLSAAYVIRSNYGSLISLRVQLEKIFGQDLIYPTISSSPLYVVHWNDLSEKKQRSLGGGRRE